MPETPDSLLERPAFSDSGVDVLSDVLMTLRVGSLLHGRLELGTPWGLRVPGASGHVGFYVLARGAAVLLHDDGDEVSLSAGDVALIPHGGAHRLRDATGRRVAFRELCEGGLLALPPPAEPGAAGLTSLLAGFFRFGEKAEGCLLAGLPRVIHMRADDARVSPSLGPTIQLLISEMSTPAPGGAVVLNRLADVMLVQALRLYGRLASCEERGLMRALSDGPLSSALTRMHAAPAEPWTVERLAAAAGMSRSAFAQRFQACVGEAPLAYLARWRMARAAELLRETELGTQEVAARVGYSSEAAFNRAFKRWRGTGPGAYRRGLSAEGQRAAR